MVGPHSPAETSTEPPPHLADVFVLRFSQGIVDGPTAERAAGRGDHGQRETDRPLRVDAPVPEGVTIGLGRRLEVGDPAADVCRIHDD